MTNQGGETMRINQRRVGDVVILDLNGKMTLGEGDEELKEEVRELLASGTRKILLNGAEQSYIDSAGLGEISRSFSHTARVGGVLKLLNPSPRVRDILEITKLARWYEIFDDEAKAVESFAAHSTQA